MEQRIDGGSDGILDLGKGVDSRDISFSYDFIRWVQVVESLCHARGAVEISDFVHCLTYVSWVESDYDSRNGIRGMECKG